MDFGLVSEINPSIPHSFKKTFLTFDIDWASDAVLEYCINILEQANVKVTWFVTHQTPLLDRLRENPNFELGIHPNFNPLLEGDFRYGNHYAKVLEYYLNIVPEAKTMRSHCLGISSRILSEAKRLGITHESNILVPMMTYNSAGGGGFLKPYSNWDKLIRCPYHWADDVACMYEKRIDICSIKSNGYFMFGFHPIHIFLNTESLNRYESARSYFKDYNLLKQYQGNSPFGSRAILDSLLGT
ncbi:hypothetical protein LS70_003350 [Helicobacter sp. MIT 11-5569]|uniref:polysaccharide deacetylase WbmS family protein n=1 Tax=Helicobacter sp. MIT 11-5569 TaxID=1548151 RepID=UPI0010FE004B|nr:hypothetical protein [Helicobacter sp. MIT 11-5569]TLD84596.1 hypothetical protein LS70_003350 [Helicobacter sp. MIT 11-5569]